MTPVTRNMAVSGIALVTKMIGDPDDFPDRLVLAEIFFSRCPVHHHGIGFCEARPGIALEKMEGEEIEKAGINEGKMVLIPGILLVFDGPVLGGEDPHSGLHFGEFLRQECGERGRGDAFIQGFAAKSAMEIHPVHVFITGMMMVKTQFEEDIDQDQHGRGHADGQTGDVNDGITFLPDKKTDGNFEVVSDHDG